MEIVEKIYDVIVIGGGPGGLSAALYSSRADLDTLILDAGLPGGQLNNTEKIENYAGFSSISGSDLAQEMYKGALQFGAEYTFGPVDRVENTNEYKQVISGKKIYRSHAVIIATGSENKKLNVSGEEEFKGRGISYCAVCDAVFYRNKEVVVVGGGNSAVEEGSYLSQFADKVTLIHRRDQLKAQKILQDRAFANDKMEFIWDTEVEEIMGDSFVNELTLYNHPTGERSQFKTDGIFIYIGLVPNTRPFADLGILNEEGWIETDEQMRTSIEGIYAVGDVRQTALRQVATAVGDGSVAGNDVFNYIQSIKE
ncbi:MAG: thioredoxin-disulfide reductase [Atopococcus tabaci]|uniref:Thioredoxin reductase n=1 Tax=Atopococcus tabaci TaxID=269774 RepID=A0AA43UCE1_9LACT|nr:thioredoxin-disulfide reductase [Atopococcus tabaci]